MALFRHLSNVEIRDIAILEYYLRARVLADNPSLSRMVEKEEEVLFSNRDWRAEPRIFFKFVSGVRSLDGVTCLFPSAIDESLYWCLAEASDDGGSYEITFYTDDECTDRDTPEGFHRLKSAKRQEHAAIAMAYRSEVVHDEAIRKAIREGVHFRMWREEFFFPLDAIRAFLDVVSPGLSEDLKGLVDDGQIMIIPNEILSEPHAGGRGIYVPVSGYDHGATVVHELFAKAGCTHDEAKTLEGVFREHAAYSKDAGANASKALPAGFADLLGDEERELLVSDEIRFAGFVDLTDVVKTRDYSRDGSS